MKSLIPRMAIFLILATVATGDPIEQALSLAKRTENLVFRDRLKANWLPDGRSFWYRLQTDARTSEFVLVQAASGERRSAPSLKGLGLPESEALRSSASKIEIHPSKRTGESSGLRFINRLDSEVDLFWIDTKGGRVSYGRIKPGTEREQQTFDGHVWLVTSRTGEPLAVVEAGPVMRSFIIDGKGNTEPPAPDKRRGRDSAGGDGAWKASIENGRVVLRNRSAGPFIPAPPELGEKPSFKGGISWSPDHAAFVACHTPDVPQRRVTIVEAAPKGSLQPKLREFDYTKPGDPLPRPAPVIFRVNDGVWSALMVKDDLFPTPFTQSPALDIRWSPDGSEFYFDYNQRGHQLYRIIAVNARSGEARPVVEETSRTFIDYTHKTWRHWLDHTGELLWMSERDGWCHLWLYDVKSARVKNQVTRGQWPVREVLHVDEAKREVWFMASGLGAAEDPYHRHLCRANLDGTGFRRLTESDGDHHVEFSPTREHFIDTWSRADHPPVHELRRASDGGLVRVLEKADASALLAAGWTLPERFTAKGRDGRTDIHGLIIKPSHFDPAKKYPVVEEVYAGPHSAFAPKEFGRMLRQHTIAELGFIVVQADGMGTNHRGKAFHDVCWKNLKDAGFPDRIAWIKAAARDRPWMDLSRVAIYGGSAGGQSAMRALLDHHEFYKVAVADCGCHDNRMDKIWWNEQWMGWPVDSSYARNSNIDDAAKLEGSLLLLVGELDNNVDPASTTQVVGALQKAGKRFEFMPIAGTGHGSAETPYGSRLRMEFLMKHLLKD